MQFHMDVANGTKKFRDTVADFAVWGEQIIHRRVLTIPTSQVQDWAVECECEMDDKFIRDYAYDTFAGRYPIDGLVISLDDSDPLYLDYKGFSCVVHRAGDTIVVFGETRYTMRGPGYAMQSMHKVDLSKFRRRAYLTPEDMTGVNADDCPVNQEHLKYSYDLDYQLLNEWLIHQFMSKIFRCTFDPFYEKDGLMHVRHNKFGDRQPEYTVPEGFDRWQIASTLRVSERYHDDDYLNVR